MWGWGFGKVYVWNPFKGGKFALVAAVVVMRMKVAVTMVLTAKQI